MGVLLLVLVVAALLWSRAQRPNLTVIDGGYWGDLARYEAQQGGA